MTTDIDIAQIRRRGLTEQAAETAAELAAAQARIAELEAMEQQGTVSKLQFRIIALEAELKAARLVVDEATVDDVLFERDEDMLTFLKKENAKLRAGLSRAIRNEDNASQMAACDRYDNENLRTKLAALEAQLRWQPVEDVEVQCVCDAPDCVGVLRVGLDMIEIENYDGIQSMVLPADWAVCRRVSS